MLPPVSELTKAIQFVESTGLQPHGAMRQDNKVKVWGHAGHCEVSVSMYYDKNPEVKVTYCYKRTPDDEKLITAITNEVYDKLPRLK